MNPAEVVKQRLQMLNSPYKTVLGCAIQVYKNEGLMAFYRSYTTQLTMNVPYQSIHFMVYEFMQLLTNKEKQYNPGAHMVSGAMAGAVAAAVTTPLDVCKTLLNTQPSGTAKGMVEAVKTVYRIGGPSAYFRGVQARVMYQMPATAICWSTYEFFKYILSSHRPEQDHRNLQMDESHAALKNEAPSEKLVKSRELPAMSAASIYGSISFNTMHTTADTSFNNNSTSGMKCSKGSILDITHT